MRRRMFLPTIVAVLLGAGLVQAQAIQSPADLFPAKIIAYAEVHQPGQLIQEIGSLFQGSVLGNVPESLARVEARIDPMFLYRFKSGVGAVGLMFAPEIIAEFKRLRGAAIGLTGIDTNGDPEFLAVILPGRSQAPSFLMRAAMTMSPMRPSGKVEGVTIYRISMGGRGGPDARRPQEIGPAVAMMPGALFIGSPEEVKNAIRRAKGKGDGETLAKEKGFQEALEETGKEPGLFVFVDVRGGWALVEGLAKHERHGREVLALINKLVNPKAVRAQWGSVTLNKGTFRYRRVDLLDPKEKSPLLELFPTTPVNSDILHFAPRDAFLVAALSNGGGVKRWTRLLELADEIAGLTGHRGGLPSAMVKQMEQQLQIDFGKDVIGKIANIAFAVGDPFSAPVRKIVEKGPNFSSSRTETEIPAVLVVEAVDEQAAQKLVEELLPRVVGMLSGERNAQPGSKEVHGQKIFTLKIQAGHGAVHYGRHGKVIVLGPYQEPVAKALAAGADKKGWLADPKSSALLKETKDPLALVVVKPVTVIMGMFLTRHSEIAVEKARVEKGFRNERVAPSPRGPKPPPVKENGKEGGVSVTVEEAAPDKEMERIKKELAPLLEKEQPLVMSVTRQKDRMIAEAKMTGLKPLVARLTDFAIERLLASPSRPAQFERGERTVPERPRPPIQPPPVRNEK